MSIDGKPSQTAEEAIHVTVTGTIETGIMAIGGESTGTVIRANGMTLEVDSQGNAELQQAMERQTGQRVELKGELTKKKGVEIRERWIIQASELK